MRINFLLSLFFYFYPLFLFADFYAQPGEIIAVKLEVKSNKKNLFIIQVDGNYFALHPVPFDKQGKIISVENNFIKVKVVDFGVSRIRINDDSQVNLSEHDKNRAFNEYKKTEKALTKFSIDNKSSLNFISPVDGIISSKYGKKRFINDQPRSPHLALDIAAPEGTKIVAPENGEVILVDNFFYSGNFLIIDHGFGLLSSYSHLSKMDVKKGQKIKKGEKIGEVGSSGRVTGPHLHWAVYLNSVKINPESLIKEDYINLISYVR